MAHAGESVSVFVALRSVGQRGGNDIPFFCVFCTVSVRMYIQNEME